MTHPWLQIPLSDYEAHMALPQVQQAQLLSGVLASALDAHRPSSMALLGCAGGNGLEQLEERSLARVVAADINPAYVEQTKQRWQGRIAGLQLVVGDVEKDALAFAPVDLAYAGLLLEYVDISVAMPRLRAMLRTGGVLVTVLQLASAAVPEITPSPYKSLNALSSIMHLVPPSQLRAVAQTHGFRLIDERLMHSEGGKQFAVQTFRAGPAPTG